MVIENAAAPDPCAVPMMIVPRAEVRRHRREGIAPTDGADERHGPARRPTGPLAGFEPFNSVGLFEGGAPAGNGARILVGRLGRLIRPILCFAGRLFGSTGGIFRGVGGGGFLRPTRQRAEDAREGCACYEFSHFGPSRPACPANLL